MHEFAYGLTNDNPHTGPTRNPWGLDRVPGGSSGGSGAALAARMVPLALGTDTGGSIRVPAAACGISGLKPTRGRVSVRGVVPLAWSLDHVGPMARSVEDLALLLETIAAPDPRDRACDARPGPAWSRRLDGDLAGLRLGVPRRAFFADLDPDVARAVEDAIAALAALGAVAVDIDPPGLEHAYTAFHTMLASEAAAFHQPWLRARPGDYGDDVRRALEQGSLIAAVDFVNARRMQAVIAEGMRETLRGVDLLATPTLPRTAPPIGVPMSREPHLAWGRLTAPFNLLGMPALSVPCGFDGAGLPIGLQLAGRWHDEATVLRAGHAYQRATDWHRRRPAEPAAATTA
jgi:aspartyl-tRNA(Asn)/glutamyl-tRNA(Gln) amidotransferase subunit A